MAFLICVGCPCGAVGLARGGAVLEGGGELREAVQNLRAEKTEAMQVSLRGCRAFDVLSRAF